MRKRIKLLQHIEVSQLYQRRSIIAIILIGLFALAILVRLVNLQIIDHRFYSTLSQHNVLNIIPLEPKRGLIYDRNGVLLAKNVPSFRLAIIPARVKNVQATLRRLQKIIPISPSEIQTFLHIRYQYRPFQAVPLKFKLNEKYLDRFYVNQFRFPGVIIQSRMLRYYPLGKVMSNVIGYVGRINARELAQVNSLQYSIDDYIGKVGIEKYYEPMLHGTVGSEEVETNANGKIVRVLKRTPPIPGKNIYLTIDSKLQAYAEKALGDNSGAIVAIDPQNGQILALVTQPSYDPNLFVNGLSAKLYQQLLNAPQHPLYNRPIRGLYSPGSTIKPFYAVSALSNGDITPNFRIYDRGYFRVPHTRHIFHDWHRSGHGWVNVTRAIIVSCDVYFYNLAMKLGMHRMDKILRSFGFGQATGVDLTEELPGLLPTPNWKMATKGKSWYSGDTINSGIGQGYVLTTPLQLASATATLAMHGVRYLPHLVLKTMTARGITQNTAATSEPPVVLQSPDAWQTVIHAMEQVIRNPEGTAEAFGRHPSFTVAGKTGTAQVFGTYRNDELSRSYLPKRLRNNHLFISFAPVKHPQIAVAVVIEHAPFADLVARKVLNFYIDEKAKPSREPQNAQS